MKNKLSEEIAEEQVEFRPGKVRDKILKLVIENRERGRLISVLHLHGCGWHALESYEKYRLPNTHDKTVECNVRPIKCSTENIIWAAGNAQERTSSATRMYIISPSLRHLLRNY